MMNEEEAVTSNGMNVDDNNTNIYSTSDSDNNRIGEDDCNLNQISQVWGTWEELLLTCAVKRHGFRDWDSIAKEIRSRSSLTASAGNCRIKYQDLKRRFYDSGDGDKNSESATAAEEEQEVGEITWVEQLRSLRMAELRRDVQRCDDSILSLQLKVKKLEEEKDGNDGDKKPDLEEDDETKPVRLNRETTESDRENRSMNESNSTGSVDKTADKTVRKNPDPDPVKAAAKEEEEEEGTVSRRSEMSNSGELGESGTSTGHKKRKVSKYRSGEDSSNRGGSGGDIKSAGDKSQPLIDIMKLIRSHPRGSVFESRLRSQEAKNYKSLIRQHLDIKTIEKKLEKGSYDSSSFSFYRDLKLLFTNAIVFFPTSSSESIAAHALQTLVANEMKKQTGKSGHSVIKSEAESSVSKLKSSVQPLVVCKKKSSVSKKPSPSSSFKQKDEKMSQEVLEEKTLTTTNVAARSSRRTGNVVAKDTKQGRAKNNNNKKQTDSKTESSNDDDDEEEKPKTEKKIASDKKKSVADFLKRIKKNSPQKGKETTSKDPKKKKIEENVKKEVKPRELRSNSTGKKKVEVENNSSKSSSKRKQPKKEAEEVAITVTGKRGRESGKDTKQQPKKRSRR